MKKSTPILIAAAVAAVALAWMAWRKPPLRVETARVARGALEVRLEHEGRTRVRDRHVIRAPLDGSLRRISLRTGDAVEAGATMIAVVDPLAPALLDERARRRAEAQSAAAAAALEQARHTHEQAASRAAHAASEHRRLAALNGEGAASVQDLERAERLRQQAVAEEGSAAAGLEVRRFEWLMAEAALDRARAAAGGESAAASPGPGIVLLAPVGGRVFRVLREDAGPVSIGEPLLEIGDLAALEVVADFLSTDAVRIEPGMPARIEGWGGPPLAGAVRLVEPSGFTKVSALGVEEQRVNVVFDLLAPQAERAALGDNFRVTAAVITWSGAELLLAPDSALFPDGPGWAAFRVQDGRARRAPVEVGRRGAIQSEVRSGLAEADLVVLYPPAALADGARVSPE